MPQQKKLDSKTVSYILSIMKELNSKKRSGQSHIRGCPLSILYIILQGIKQFFCSIGMTSSRIQTISPLPRSKIDLFVKTSPSTLLHFRESCIAPESRFFRLAYCRYFSSSYTVGSQGSRHCIIHRNISAVLSLGQIFQHGSQAIP